MPKRSSRDFNQLAAGIVASATSGGETPKKKKRKNPAAVALGRLGGLKGGKSRAASLSPEQRTEIARKAALARYAKKS
jgi:hypothetical protein